MPLDQYSKIVINRGLKPINPFQCGYHRCSPSHGFGPAIREHWLLHFVVSGKGIFRTQRGETVLSGGDMFIIRPYEVTYYEADAADPWNYYWIGFTSEIPLPPRLTANDSIRVPYLKELFVSAFECEHFDDGDTDGAYEHYLCGVIWQMLGLLMRENTVSAGTAANYVEPAISMIRSEYQTALTVSDIASRLHINRSYFFEIFKAATGMSPKKYLENVRMQRAAELLTKRAMTVTVTASSVGYPDVFAFSRAFKRYYSCSPTEYVEKFQAKS